MRYDLIVLTAIAFFLGFIASEWFSTPKPVRLENTPYCLHSEYSSMKALRELKVPVHDALVDVGRTVRVWVQCGLEGQNQ